MAVSDAIVVIFTILAFWLTINYFSHVENEIYKVVNATITNNETRTTNDYIHSVQAENIDIFNDAAPFVILSLLTVVVLTNAFTSLHPFAYGIFSVILFVAYYVVATWIIPVVVPDLQATIIGTDTAPNYIDFVLTNWNWTFIALFVGTIIGYIRGGESGSP